MKIFEEVKNHENVKFSEVFEQKKYFWPYHTHQGPTIPTSFGLSKFQLGLALADHRKSMKMHRKRA